MEMAASVDASQGAQGGRGGGWPANLLRFFFLLLLLYGGGSAKGVVCEVQEGGAVRACVCWFAHDYLVFFVFVFETQLNNSTAESTFFALSRTGKVCMMGMFCTYDTASSGRFWFL